MRQGIIVEINHEQGYGFIKEMDQGFYIRFNTADLAENLSQHASVVFSILDLDPGRMAVNICPLNKNQHKAS